MDRISVTDATLQNAYVVLQQLNDSSESITTQCISALSSQLNGLDSTFRVDVQRYIETITTLKEKLKYCIDENMNAISERLSKIPDYENKTYKKRNII